MQRIFSFMISVFVAAMCLSCTQELAGDLTAREQARQALTGQTVTLDAYDADATLATKTSRADDGSVLWSPGDKISVFYGSGSNGGCEFTSTNQEPAGRVQFTGKINVITGLSEGTEDIMFWGIYPYSWNNSCNGSSVTMWLSDTQRAADNTWADEVFPAIGHSSGLAMGFYNLCGGLIFYVTEDGINRIDFRGKNDEVLAGPVTVAFNDGVPAITSFQDTLKDIFLMAPYSYGTTAAYDTFKKTTPGDTTWYFLILPPMTFSQGHTITFHKNDGTYGVREFGKRTVTRNKFTRIRSAALNSGVVYKPNPPQSNQIYYTTTDGKVATFKPDGTHHTANDIISNTYADGKGVITFSGPVTYLDDEAFNCVVNLKTITLPDCLETIGANTFRVAESLTQVNFGAHTKIIRNSAFELCKNLADLDLPEGLQYICSDAFYGCSSLESVTLPSSLLGIGSTENADGQPTSTLGYNPFRFCSNLSAFYGTVPNYTISNDHKFLLNADGSYIISGVLAASAYKDTDYYCIVPSTVKHIGNMAFQGGGFKGILLPDGIQYLHRWCFATNSALIYSVNIPGSVVSIQQGAFSRCPNLQNIEFSSDKLPLAGTNAFGGADDDTDTDFPIYIPGYACATSNDRLFGNVDAWMTYRTETSRVTLYQPADEIWVYSTGDSTNPYGIPASMGEATKINQVIVFSSQNFSLKPRVHIPSSLSSATLVVAKYNARVTTVPANAFKETNSTSNRLLYVSLPPSVTTIGDNAFKDCNLLKVFPGSRYSDANLLTSIGAYAFTNCSEMAFEENRNFLDLSSVTSLGEYAFYGCKVLGSDDPPVRGSILLLGQVPSFPAYVFYNCAYLTHIEIFNDALSDDAVNSITAVGGAAFSGCDNLMAINSWSLAAGADVINLPGVTRIAFSAFNGCKLITDVTLGNVATISKEAFLNCKALKNVTLNTQTLTSVEEKAFYNCPYLKNVKSSTETLNGVLLPKVTSVGTSAFGNSGSTQYGGFDYVQIGNSVNAGVVVSIGLSAFANCTALNTVNLPNTTVLPNSGFRNCTNLQFVVAPKITEVQSEAFYGCSGLKKLTLSSVTSIGDRAFAYTRSLTDLEFGPNLTTLGAMIFYDDSNDNSVRNYGKLELTFAGPYPTSLNPEGAPTFGYTDNVQNLFWPKKIYIDEDYYDNYNLGFADDWDQSVCALLQMYRPE